MTLRTVGVRLVAEVSDYQQKIRGAGRTTADFTAQMDRAAKGGHLDAVADGAGVAGLALAGMAGYAVKAAADFDKAMSAVSAATHASTADIGRLREAALQAGKDTKYSATQAAGAITELSKAGVSTADVLGGGLKGALSLAAAGQMDVSEAAETAASALTQFRLKGKDLPHVADLLAAAAGKAQGSVHDMGYALSQSGLVANQFGLSIEDTTGALAQFANAGLIGSDAGTSFKTMLLAMANPSDVTKKKMHELGITFYDAQGRFKGLSGVATELRDKLAHLTEEERNAALGQIYGSDAIRAATILYRDGAKGVEEWRTKVNDAGYAAETAAKLTDNLAGDLERLRSNLETLAIESGSGANSGLRVLTQAANALVNEFASLPPAVGGTVTVLTGAAGAALLLGAGWVKLRRSTAEMYAELGRVGPAGERTAAGLQATTKWAGRAAAAFAALEVAGAVIHSFQDDLNPQLDALSVGLQRFADTGKVAGEASRVLGDDLGDLKTGFKFLADGDNSRRAATKHMQDFLEWLPIGLDGTNTSLTRTRERITAMDAALAQLASGGKADEAKKVFDALAKQLAVSGVSMEEFRKQFPQYAAALEAAGKATTTTTGDVKQLGETAEGASGQMIALSKSINELFQVQISADRAALKLAESTEDLTKELTKGARTLSLNTAEGRKNRAAVLDQLDAIEAVRDARVRGGLAIDEATKKYDKDIAGLRKSMIQAGFTKKQIDDLIGAYEDIPDKVNTKVSTTGVPGVEAQLDRLSVYQQALKKGIIPKGFHGPVRGPDGKFYAEGGWTGPGGKWDEAGIVHADEFVIRKDARRSIETQAPGLLDAMNTSGMAAPPGYATGGRVAVWPFPVTARGTRIPSRAEVAAAVVPAGGHTSDWIVAAVRAAFPGMAVLSKDRPGSRTLTGNTSYHARGRAVDFPPSRPLAEWVNANHFAATRELITPWQGLNILNGRRHAYSPLVYNQHNFAGGNAHDHWAMAHGGTITEPIFGVGASGRTYSFGENYQPERVVPGYQPAGGGAGTTVNLTVNAPLGAHPREIGRQVVDAIGTYLQGGGELRINGSRVF